MQLAFGGCSIGVMTEPKEARDRSVDPFNAPEDFSDPWRGRSLPILIVTAVVIILAVVLVLLLI